MTDHSSNPFVLPGMGQGSSDAAGNPLLASMEMMRQAWAGLTGPGGLAQVMPMTPPMNLPDLERRIAELRSVESWLRMNLSMLSSTIQGLEVQRSTIATLRSFVDNLGAQGQDAGAWGGASPLEVVLGLKPAPGGSAAASKGTAGATWPGADAASGGQDTRHRAGTAAEPPGQTSAPSFQAPPPDTDANTGADAGATPAGSAGSGGSAGSAGLAGSAGSAGSAQAISQAAQSASEAWWGMLQQQFNQLAAATAATMPGMPGAAADPASARQGAPAGGQDAAPVSSGAASGAGKKTPSQARPATPRKTPVRKNKIQSDPDQS